MAEQVWDILIIGGGINGCGIARDASGRGLKVVLCEKGDLAQATSSASTKLFHGGLRYLEYFEFRLVREALRERETLLAAMPHISWPLRFVLPLSPDMRFDTNTPTARLLRWIMPWRHESRPDWLIRLGLLIYDSMGGRKVLPATRTIDLTRDPAGAALKAKYHKAFEYSDCWVEDSRLVALNARDAADKGATILTRTECVSAERTKGVWLVTLRDLATGTDQVVRAQTLVNAGGPWVENIVRSKLGLAIPDHTRLVRGSHIVTRRLFEHDRPYFFQLADGRIIFAIPYETDFTLIGTTDLDHDGDPASAKCTDAEREYLCRAASEYFREPVREKDVVWSYSGVRPLYDDGASSATAATRDYVLKLESEGGPALLNVFGGKITTYRKLAEAAIAKLSPHLPALAPAWTAGSPLPGGDFGVGEFDDLVRQLQQNYPFLDANWAKRLVRAYGTRAFFMLAEATSAEDLGRNFGWNLTEREVIWLRDHEFARAADDVLWRRSKLGLRLSPEEAGHLQDWFDSFKSQAVTRAASRV